MINGKEKEELKGLRCLYSSEQRKFEIAKETIKALENELHRYKEPLATISGTDEIRIERLERERDDLIDECRDSIRERDSLYTDKKRLEAELISLRAGYNDITTQYTENSHDKQRLESEVDRLKTTLQEEERKQGPRTQKLTITKERLEYILNRYYEFEALKIDKILVGTQPPTLCPGSSEFELDIPYTKDEEE